MTTSSIFKYANNISVSRDSNSARSITTGGYARTQRLGPTVISIKADLPLLSEEQHGEVQQELMSIDDGMHFLNVNVSANNGNNIMQKTAIPMAAGETEIKIIMDKYITYREIVLCNLASNISKIFKVGDFLQFNNHAKVYQISKPAGETGVYFNSTNSGKVRVRLSSQFASGVGASNSLSSGITQKYQFVNGTSDLSSSVKYTYNYNTTGSSQTGVIEFRDEEGDPWLYADGQAAIYYVRSNYYSPNNVAAQLNIGATGTYTALSTAQDAMNTKVKEILISAQRIGSNSSGGEIQFNFNQNGIRAAWIIPMETESTFEFVNETVVSTIANPAVEGKIKFKNSDNTYAKFRDGTDAEIIIPKEYQTAQDIYNYLRASIVYTNSPHKIVAENIVTAIGGGSFSEYFGETNVDHSGGMTITYGVFVGVLTPEYTPTASIATAYNPHTPTGDIPYSVVSTGVITILNATQTYNVGEFISPVGNAATVDFYTKKITGVNINGPYTELTTETNKEGAHLTMNNFSAADPLRPASTWTNVSGTSTGSGDVGTFNIVTDGTGAITSVTVTDVGDNHDHVIGDTITILDSQLGGGGAADFTMDVETIATNVGSGAGNGSSGWSSSLTYSIIKHLNTASSSSTGLLTDLGVTHTGTLYTSLIGVLMGPDVNMKLMLTSNPSVTIVPLNETENLYKFDTFSFKEVL